MPIVAVALIVFVVYVVCTLSPHSRVSDIVSFIIVYLLMRTFENFNLPFEKYTIKYIKLHFKLYNIFMDSPLRRQRAYCGGVKSIQTYTGSRFFYQAQNTPNNMCSIYKKTNNTSNRLE